MIYRLCHRLLPSRRRQIPLKKVLDFFHLLPRGPTKAKPYHYNLRERRALLVLQSGINLCSENWGVAVLARYKVAARAIARIFNGVLNLLFECMLSIFLTPD